MNWQTLLNQNRIGKSPKDTPPNPLRSEFRRDGDRITFSTAFRRLQDKTQVFPLADNDYVRTRLTHSLEVASVARSLGARVGGVLCERHGLTNLHFSDFGEITSAAALAHDLGNPPFGHSGEDAIRHWFLHSPHAREAAQELTPSEHADFARYEGNAQGFRLLTKLQMPDNPGGLQLTYATLGAFTKYPRASDIGADTNPTGASTKKFGFYRSELEEFRSVAAACELIPRTAQSTAWARHPLAFLVEAADDICYRLVDFEDGFRLGHLGYATVRDAFMELIPESHRPTRLECAHSDGRRVQILRSIAIGAAIERSAELFLDHESALLDGSFDLPLLDAGPDRSAWEHIEKISRETIYSTPRGVEIEAAGFEVLGGLLDVFVSALNDHAQTKGRPAPRSRKLLHLLPAQSLGPERIPSASAYARLLGIFDFVSGMTDTYAVTLYKKIRGISLAAR
jgi:dGTPase